MKILSLTVQYALALSYMLRWFLPHAHLPVQVLVRTSLA